MKNIRQKLGSIIAAFTVVFLTSCGSDDSVTADLPSLTVSATLSDGTTILSNGGNVEVGESVIFTINATAPGGFNALDISGSITDNIDRNELGLDAGTTQTTIVLDPIGTTETGNAVVNFVVVDDLNQLSDTLAFSFTIISPNAKSVAQVLLAPPLGDNTSLTFYSIANDTRYSHGDVIGTADPISATIDLGYYWGSTDNASLAAPAAYPTAVFDISAWTTKKNTQIVLTTLTMEDFMAIVTVDDVTSAIQTITFTGNIETDLEVGDVLAFQTDDTVPISGFIYVAAITGTDGQGDSIDLQFVYDQAE